MSMDDIRLFIDVYPIDTWSGYGVDIKFTIVKANITNGELYGFIVTDDNDKLIFSMLSTTELTRESAMNFMVMGFISNKKTSFQL